MRIKGFITIMLRDCIDEIRAFARQDYETAVVPEEGRKYLSRRAESAHHEIASHPSSANSS